MRLQFVCAARQLSRESATSQRPSLSLSRSLPLALPLPRAKWDERALAKLSGSSSPTGRLSGPLTVHLNCLSNTFSQHFYCPHWFTHYVRAPSLIWAIFRRLWREQVRAICLLTCPAHWPAGRSAGRPLACRPAGQPTGRERPGRVCSPIKCPNTNTQARTKRPKVYEGWTGACSLGSRKMARVWR